MCRKSNITKEKKATNQPTKQPHENIYYNNSAMTMREYWAVAYNVSICSDSDRFDARICIHFILMVGLFGFWWRYLTY